MKAEQKWKNGQGKLQKKVKKSVGLGICVFLTLLLVSQLHYEKRIQKFVLRNEEQLTEFTKNNLPEEQRERPHIIQYWKEENAYGKRSGILYGRFWAGSIICVLWILLFTRRYSGWNRGRSACKSRGRQCGLELAGIRRQWRRDSKNKTALVLL